MLIPAKQAGREMIVSSLFGILIELNI